MTLGPFLGVFFFFFFFFLGGRYASIEEESPYSSIEDPNHGSYIYSIAGDEVKSLAGAAAEKGKVLLDNDGDEDEDACVTKLNSHLKPPLPHCLTCTTASPAPPASPASLLHLHHLHHLPHLHRRF